MKNRIFTVVAITIVMALLFPLVALAAGDAPITAYYRDKIYNGTERECKTQAAIDFGGTPCDYEYFPDNQRMYNLEIFADKRQYNLDAFGIDLGEAPAGAAESAPPYEQTGTPCEYAQAVTGSTECPIRATLDFLKKHWLESVLIFALAVCTLCLVARRKRKERTDNAKKHR